MKKTMFIIFSVSVILIFITSLFLNMLWERDFNKFDCNSAKKEANKYLIKNEMKLIKIVNELYESKSSKKNPYKGVRYASYENKPEINTWNENNYIKFDLDGQGMLGGQYYGLIYSNDNNFFDKQDLIIYDESKGTNNGNNIFIRQKIKDNWYFYYDDFDGKVDTGKLK